MKPRISVEAEGGDRYRVTVDDGRGSTEHRVTAPPSLVASLGGGAAAERVVEASFRFLLDREPKESILRSFALSVIEDYFPSYPRDLAGYLAR